MASLAKASAILGRALLPQTAEIKMSGWRMPTPGDRYERSIKGTKRLIEVVRILHSEDRSARYLHPMHTLLVRIIK